MNKLILLLWSVVLLSACRPREYHKYEYETNPAFSWGYAEFWGPYYAKYDVEANVSSISLFSDSLSVDSTGALTGFGQYAYLEDVFYNVNYLFLPEGEYQVSKSSDTLSIAPGEELDIDGTKFDTGAFLYFIEKDANYSVKKQIVAGTMTVAYQDSLTVFDCKFELDDETEISGTYRAVLPYIDYSSIVSGSGPFFVRPGKHYNLGIDL